MEGWPEFSVKQVLSRDGRMPGKVEVFQGQMKGSRGHEEISRSDGGQSEIVVAGQHSM